MSEELIYHYTSLSTLCSILENKTLRLADITKSNDSREITWIKEYIDDEFAKSYQKSSLTQYKDLMFEMLHHSVEDWFSSDHRYYSYYVCCFSKVPDLLSQWRGYADDAAGVCIGFDRSMIEALVANPSQNIFLSDIDYDPDRQKQNVRKVIDGLITVVEKIAKTKVLTKELLIKPFNDAFNKLFKLAICMKNHFFNEEAEVRLCFCPDRTTVLNRGRNKDNGKDISWTGLDDFNIKVNNNSYLKALQYQVNGGNIKSYFDLCFEPYLHNIYESDKGIIREIITGPKSSLTEDEIRFLLFQNNFHASKEAVTVKPSVGTYR